jgi:putative ABC transport system permease protein
MKQQLPQTEKNIWILVTRISMPWWIYMMGGVAAIVIALLTVGFQTVRAARANPVNSLKAE